jgi:hypothetical protein
VVRACGVSDDGLYCSDPALPRSIAVVCLAINLGEHHQNSERLDCRAVTVPAGQLPTGLSTNMVNFLRRASITRI